MKETELAQRFVDYLSDFDLYFEVDYYRSVDIVALNGRISAAYEVKTTFNFKVLEQAIENSKHFNYSYIAVPEFKDGSIQLQLCRDYGLGLIMYDNKHGYHDVREWIHPRLNRHVNNNRLIENLHVVNKLSKPGAQSGDGEKITAFQITVENAVRYVQRHPGCTIKEMVDKIIHHYSTDKLACTNIYGRIYQGVIKELRLECGKLYTTI